MIDFHPQLISHIFLKEKNDKPVKSQKAHFSVIPAPHQVRDKLRRESRGINYFWALAFEEVTALETFYKTIKNVLKKREKFPSPIF